MGWTIPMAVFTTIIVVFGVLLFGLPGGSSNEGIYLEFNLYEIRNGKLVPVKPTPDMYLYLKIEAVAPGRTAVLAEVNMKMAKKIFIPTGELRKIAQEWVKEYEGRNSDIKNFWSGLIITIAISRFMNKTVEQLYYAVDSASYKPYVVEKTGKLKIRLHLRKDIHTASPEVEYDISPLEQYTDVRNIQLLSAQRPPKEPLCFSTYVEEPVYIVTPENLTNRQALPSDYFYTYGGKIYVKTPILIVNNVDSYSGVVSASIGIFGQPIKAAAYLTVSTGKIIETITKERIPGPDITIWKSSDATWGGVYLFSRGASAFPNRAFWVWIWARPVFGVYRVYNGYECYGEIFRGIYLYDKAVAYIEDVLVINGVIQGSNQRGLPHQNIINILFSNVEFTNLKIPNTVLADGKLDPGEEIDFSYIFPYFDKCGTDFEVNMPVGAMAALLLCSKAGGFAPICAGLLSNIGVSLSHQGSTIYIAGALKNEGATPDGGYNVSEYVYMAVSNYQYRSGSCYYNVPVATYFETR